MFNKQRCVSHRRSQIRARRRVVFIRSIFPPPPRFLTALGKELAMVPSDLPFSRSPSRPLALDLAHINNDRDRAELHTLCCFSETPRTSRPAEPRHSRQLRTAAGFFSASTMDALQRDYPL